METQTTQPPFETWGLLEVMGHLRLAGKISEQTIAGAGFVRIDIPQQTGDGFNTRLFSPQALYGITPTDEATARALALRYAPAPVQPYELLPPGQARYAAEMDELTDAQVEDGADRAALDEDERQERLPF